MGHWQKYPWYLRAGALLLALALAWLPALLWPQGVSTAEGVVADAFWRWGAVNTPERRVVVVDIDEQSLAQIGPWPWPRDTVARLSQQLTRAGALVQGYDIAFADEREGDDQLANAWAAAPAVVSQILSIDSAARPAVGRLAGGMPGICPPFAPQAQGHYGTSATLLRAHPVVGHITPRVEADGVVRRLPALICVSGRSHASLSLAMLWRASQPERLADDSGAPVWQWHQRSHVNAPGGWLSPSAWLTSPSLPGVTVPLDRDGSLRVPYHAARSAFLSLPAADVLRGKVDALMLKGAIVLIGASAFGTGDTVATPLSSVASGVEVHAQSLVGLLDGRVPYVPAASGWLQAATVLLLSAALLGVAVMQRGAPAKRLPISGVLLATLVVAGAGAALVHGSLALPWLQLAVFAIVASVALATVEHALARAQGQRLSAHLGAYLPQPVAQRLMVSDPSGSLQVDQRHISVLVADIRNFSAHAAHHSPEETAALLHAFVSIAVEVVERHGGVLENVIGDAVLAVWNASPGMEHHPERALAAARELCRSTQPLLSSRKPFSELSPVQPLALGVGLESGPAIVGLFGPARRRAHAALGEPVSVANRLQQMTSDLSMPILIGPQLAQQLPSDGLEPLGEYLLEGMGKHYQVYAPVGWSDLVDVDPNWASAAGASDTRSSEPPDEWSRWGHPSGQQSVAAFGDRRIAPYVIRSA